MRKFLFAALILSTASGCYYDNMQELNPASVLTCTVPVNVSFTNDIKPVLNSGCGTTNSGCHNSPTATNNMTGLNSYTDVVAAANGNLMDAVNHTGSVSAMPKDGGKLDNCSISILQKWIDQGMLNN